MLRTLKHSTQTSSTGQVLHVAVASDMFSMDKDTGDGPLTRHAFELLLQQVSVFQFINLVHSKINIRLSCKEFLSSVAIRAIGLGPHNDLMAIVFVLNQLTEFFLNRQCFVVGSML